MHSDHENGVDRRTLLMGAGAASLAAPLMGARAPGNSPKPNVLLIYMDDQTHRSLGFLNNPEVRTPHLDRLARRGTTFTHAFNQGAWSGAVCIPSRAMLISGLTVWHSEHRLNEVPLWGEWFQQHGYNTFMTGKWHNGDETLHRCFGEIGPHAGGFLPSLPDTPEPSNDAYFRPSPGNNWRPDDMSRGGHWMNVDGTIVHSSERWASAAVDYLDRHAKRSDKKPFFMHVAFHAPHDPRQCPKAFLDMYPIEKISVPPNFQPEHPFDQGDSRVRDELLTPFPRTEEAVRLHRHEYYALLSHVDSQIGRILDHLDATGLTSDTFVLFSSDHGLAVGEHGLMGKQNLYEHSIRIPLIMAGPKIPPGAIQDALVYQSGLFPTACDLCGLATPKSVEHKSMAPLLRKGSRSKGYSHIYGGYMRLQRMVRNHEWKLILYPPAGRTQLFHIATDPWELHDLSGDPRHAETIANLKLCLRELQAELGDTLEIS